MDATASATAAARCRASDAEEAAFAKLQETAPHSLAAMFMDRVAKSPTREALRGNDGTGHWTSYTWAETGAIVSEIAAGLLAVGLAPEDRVAIASGTRVEWIMSDLGILCAGGATTTVYPTSTIEDVRHIVTDSGSRFAIVENLHQLAKLEGTGTLERIVLIDGTPDHAARPGDSVLTLADLRQLGRSHLAAHPDAVKDATAGVKPHQLATLIYTSGTTGRPKGVRLSHSSWVYEGLATIAIGLVDEADVGYLWLPMSHSFGKTLLSSAIAVGHAGVVDGAVDRIIVNLPEVRPTTMAGAPRIFEKVYAGVVARVNAEGGAKLRIFNWAIDVGRRVSRLKQQGRQPNGLLAVQHRLADRLVFSTIRERFGGRIRFFISGSAALSGEVAEWFHAVGMLVLEGYGLTESAAGTFVNRPDNYEFGTVGQPMPGTSVKIADDGEILLKGPGIMQGYHHLDAATAEVLTEHGWLRTGDVGHITAKGNLKITDRKKDLIKTSGGKYVAPQVIETEFKAICPLASQIIVHGEGRKFVSALVALDPDAVKVWAQKVGRADAAYAELATSPQMRSTVEGYIEQLNSRLGKWETIKKFEILDRDLTVEAGQLTPSLKLKRRVVEQEYAEVLDSFYRE